MTSRRTRPVTEAVLTQIAVAAPPAQGSLGSVPIVVMVLYVILLVGLALYGYLRSKLTEDDYYLAGRNQSFIVTALTIMATFFSSAALLGIPGAVYKDGAAFLFFALNFLPRDIL